MAAGQRAVLLASLALLPGPAGCAPAGTGREVDRLTLHQGLLRAERVALVVPEGPLAAAARRAARREVAPRSWPRLVWCPPGGGGGAPRILVGTPQSPELAPVLARLPLERDGELLRLADAPEVGLFDVLAATLADPERPGLPISVLVATDTTALAPWIERAAPNAWPSLAAWRRGDRVAEAELEPGGALRAGSLVRFELGLLAPEGPPERASGIALFGVDDAELARAYLERLAGARERVLAVARAIGRPMEGASGVPKELRVVGFAHPEDLARATGRAELAVVNELTGRVAALVAPGLDDGGAGLARALARELLGPPDRDWLLDGLAVHAAGSWWGRPLEEWVAGLAAGGLVPARASEVLGEAWLRSEHVVLPLRAAFFDYWLATAEPGALAELWSGARELDAAALWPGFRAHLDELAARHAPARDAERAERRARFEAHPFRCGLNLCAPLDPAEPDRARGFGSRAAERSLQRAAWVGANAVAVCASAVSFPGGPRAPFEPVRQGPALVDSDLSLVWTLRAAAAQGQSAMLRPFVFETPSGDWAGDHVEESEERAETFFDRYGRLLVHAAALAELGGAELLCVGTELPQATRTDPLDDPWIPDFTNLNPQRWRTLIDRARGVFGGALTYAADVRAEAAEVTFWDALDRPGLELYNPLSVSPEDEAPPERGVVVSLLRQELQWAQALGERCAAPCLVVELGFPASSLAWQYPAEPRGTPDPREQARLYAALAQAFEIEQQKLTWVGGLYLWNWSTDPAAGRAEDESFTPQGRPGEHFLRRLFAVAAKTRRAEPAEGR